MLFNSYVFIFAFLPITFFIYFYLNKKKYFSLGKIFLIFSSLFFYAWWNIIYLPIILISIYFNYKIGHFLVKDKPFLKKISKKNLLRFGIIANILLLGYFKYRDFFIENVNFIFNSDFVLLEMALPLALSFFTFQQISYLVDSYKKELTKNSFLDYALFVTFFPQLIAGPIVQHKEMMGQFASKTNTYLSYQNIAMGLFIFNIGLFKKVVIADTFSVWANNGFDVAVTLNFLEAWATSLSYTFQLYFDFSGYTDMAIGIALLFNIKLPINFNSPYKAQSIQDFWRRWHLTLSRFLRDYIYIPLGGNKQGSWRTYRNLMITFILAGFWHGAGWTFVFWGFLHGLALIVHRLWRLLGFKLWAWVAWLLTFNFINISWIFFRAKEWDDALKILKSMFNIEHIVLPSFLENNLLFLSEYQVSFGNFLVNIKGESATFIWLFLAFIITLYCTNSIEKLKVLKLNIQTAFFSAILFMMSIISLNKVSEFLYFNF